MSAAHEETVTIRFIERWPAHEPRKDDPMYRYFHAAKERMRKAGLLVCNVKCQPAEHYGPVELHHSYVEFAHQNQIDLAKFNEVWGLHLDDDEFAQFVEGVPAPDGQCALEPLCTGHHRGVYGVHSLPSPEWNVLRTAKDGTAPVTALSNSGIGVVTP